MDAFWNWLKSVFSPKQVDNINTSEKPPEMHPISGDWKPPSIAVKSSRTLSSKLEAIIDKELMRIAPNALREAVEKKDANSIAGLACKALSSLKIREKSGNNDGEFVELIQHTSGGERGYAWCMYEQQTGVAYAEKKTGKVSKIYSSGSCASVRSKSASMAISYKDSKLGDIWIWKHTNGNGHTGNFEKWITLHQAAILNEGNTTAGKVGDKIVREGGGAYQTERKVELESSSNMRLVMVIRPF